MKYHQAKSTFLARRKEYRKAQKGIGTTYKGVQVQFAISLERSPGVAKDELNQYL